MTDFTNCPIVPGRAYNGANGSKIAVEYGGGMEKIAAFIDGTPVISDLQKQFYSRYLQARYDLILSPAYKLIEPQK